MYVDPDQKEIDNYQSEEEWFVDEKISYYVKKKTNDTLDSIIKRGLVDIKKTIVIQENKKLREVTDLEKKQILEMEKELCLKYKIHPHNISQSKYRFEINKEIRGKLNHKYFRMFKISIDERVSSNLMFMEENIRLPENHFEYLNNYFCDYVKNKIIKRIAVNHKSLEGFLADIAENGVVIGKKYKTKTKFINISLEEFKEVLDEKIDGGIRVS